MNHRCRKGCRCRGSGGSTLDFERAANDTGGTLSKEPELVEPIQNVTVVAGRDVKLSCVVDNLGTYKVAWIAFDKSAILTVQDSVITRNPRVSVSHDGQRTWTLHLSKVNASDAGTYMCQVNTIVAKSQLGILKVVVPPYIVDNRSSRDMMVQEGASLNLTCSATGTPPPSITWRREDHMKININKTYQTTEYEGASLPLARVSRMDMAAYLCIARNGVPPIVSKRIQVSVNFPPMMSIPHQLVGAPLGYSVTLECTIEAHPPALTYWTRGQDVMLHQSNKYHIDEKPGEVSYLTHMKLTISNLKKSDFGSYKCVAKNSRGETEGLIKLYGECEVLLEFITTWRQIQYTCTLSQRVEVATATSHARLFAALPPPVVIKRSVPFNCRCSVARYVPGLYFKAKSKVELKAITLHHRLTVLQLEITEYNSRSCWSQAGR
ncbi:lachesin-like [Penaeus monodon]|uniref:lachesin-like n=1 Tax=Penaeus monodon TaxID=6687 RepID=UPI0018A723FE|nr:lachesin-like [Penaeus monodon]